jgi:hypothetical protein
VDEAVSVVSLTSSSSEFLQKLVNDKKIHEARAFNFTYRYIDDVLFINYSRFAEFLPLIYPGPVACFSDEDDVSGNQNNCYWPLHSKSIARCKHHM